MQNCKTSTQSFPIFIISLKNADDRRKSIVKKLNALGLKFEIFDAVEGKKLTQDELNEYCDANAIKSSHILTPGAIGCALSHYFIYKEIIKRDVPFALVLEDDVQFNSDVTLEILETIGQSIQQNEISLLYYQSWNPLQLIKKTEQKLHIKYSKYTPLDIAQPITTAAYFIGKEACKNLTNVLLPIRFTADCWIDFYKLNGFSELTCIYPRPLNTTDAKSTIDYVENKRLQKILTLVNQYKVFPIFQILKRRRKKMREKMLHTIIK